ncbi:hypothetical protein DET49_13441 [Salegentibacter sp. 24]|jgi:hypothetical protein|uniref:hypothetical protein n=1 Tax=Salegentibacter sp. 24 TaxID=2183986 RepID=UPI0010E1BC63|nr:hypothetical protein DET49_13441 [Salegentibacter sp. 24]
MIGFTLTTEPHKMNVLQKCLLNFTRGINNAQVRINDHLKKHPRMVTGSTTSFVTSLQVSDGDLINNRIDDSNGMI